MAPKPLNPITKFWWAPKPLNPKPLNPIAKLWRAPKPLNPKSLNPSTKFWCLRHQVKVQRVVLVASHLRAVLQKGHRFRVLGLGFRVLSLGCSVP